MANLKNGVCQKLSRMWENGNPHALVERVQIQIDTLENSLAVLNEIKIVKTFWFSKPIKSIEDMYEDFIILPQVVSGPWKQSVGPSPGDK